MIFPLDRRNLSRRTAFRLLGGGLAAPIISSCSRRRTTKRPPNIVLVLADDLGWNQLNCYGNGFYETPNIDRLASEGIRFAQAYAAAPVCSPTRASLMTGRNPARLHITNYIPGSPYPYAKVATRVINHGLPLEEVTVAEMLKDIGYTNGHFGKWHLNRDKEYQSKRPGDPASQGFDTVLTTVKPDADDDPASDAHHVKLITDHAIDFIDANKENPFFCYVTHNLIHRPQLERPDLVAKYKAKTSADPILGNNPVAGAMVETLDASVGRLLMAIDEADIAENTLVIFFSDNGPLYGWTERKPLVGGKGDLYEGGIRVPMIVRWPGVTPSGAVNNIPVISDDFLPTIAELTGATLPGTNLDGVSVANLFRGEAAPVRDNLCFHYPHYHRLTSDDGVVDHPVKPHGAIREGKFKLIEWFERSLQSPDRLESYDLFDLEADPGERENLAGKMQQKTRELAVRLSTWRKNLGAHELQLNPAFDAARADWKDERRNG